MLQGLDEVQQARYGATYRKMIDRVVARERNGSSPQVVADLILRVLNTTTPKTRYLVGRDARRLALLARWMPDGLFDHLRLRLFGLPTEFGGARAADTAFVPTSSERASDETRRARLVAALDLSRPPDSHGAGPSPSSQHGHQISR